MNNRDYLKTTLCLYLNYFVHGMGIVILSQNMLALSQKWGSDIAGVSMVISSLGIGRLLVLYVSGNLSDRFGRKIFVQIGVLTYVIFFLGILISQNVVQAYIAGIFAGMANSFLDSGTYPALMEMHPKRQASVNILIKAFASIGELILPIMVAALELSKAWYGWSFVVCSVILLSNLIFLRNRKFPESNKLVPHTDETRISHKLTIEKWFLGIVLTIFGYVSMSTFYLVSQWLTKYGETVAHLDMPHARLLVSIYSVGSILGVLISVLIVDRFIKAPILMLLNTITSFVALLVIASFSSFPVMSVASFVIGVSAAGGVMQIGLTIMSEIFPNAKGRITGIYYTASALSSFTIPVITAAISKNSIHNIIWFDVGIAAVGIFCSVMVIIFFKRVK